MNFEEIYTKRRSDRYLKKDELDEITINKILEAGMHAPIAMGQYDNVILYVLKDKKLEDFKDLFIKETGADIFYNCGLIILVFHKGLNDALKNQDTGCILENVCLECASLNLGSVYSYSVARYCNVNEKLRNFFNVSSEYKLTAGAIIGKIDKNKVSNVSHKMEVIY